MQAQFRVQKSEATSDSTGVYALYSLINYCNSHGLTKLGDVKVDDVLKEPVSEPLMNLAKELGVDVSAGAPSPSPSNPEQRELADQWARWLKQSLDFCGADERCKEIANRTFANNLRCTKGDRLACDDARRGVADWNAKYRAPQADDKLEAWVRKSLAMCGSDKECVQIVTRVRNHTVACSAGDHKACGDRENDLVDIGRWNAEHRAPQANPQNTLMQCLQETATRVVTWCKETNCPAELGLDIIGEAQKTQCGYSAIQPIQPIQSRQPGNPQFTSCDTTPTSGGGWITTCQQF